MSHRVSFRGPLRVYNEVIQLSIEKKDNIGMILQTRVEMLENEVEQILKLDFIFR